MIESHYERKCRRLLSTIKTIKKTSYQINKNVKFLEFQTQVNTSVDALTVAATTTATTMHWFAQIGHDLIENDERDNGEGKT